MIYNEDTYYVGYHRNVRELGAVPALIFDTIAGLILNSDGCIGNDTIAELLGITERYLRQQIDVLIRMGYIDKVAGNGRGKKTTYVLTEKGEQNAPLYAQKGGTKRHKKGEQNAPLKEKELNKDINNNFMEDFSKFWDLFKADEDYQGERERCERFWYLMPDDKKQSVIRDLEDGKRNNKTKSPYVYLRYYEKPLRYMRQDQSSFEKWRKDNVNNNRRMCMVRFEDRMAFCIEIDLPDMIEAGAELINGDWGKF